MARTWRPSVSLWQTGLFVIVIVVAILLLSLSLSGSLQGTLGQLGADDQLSDASVLASQLSNEYPLTVESLARVRGHVEEFRQIYGDDVWVYDVDGTLRLTAAEGELPEDVSREAFVGGLADSPPYSDMSLASDGYVVAGKAVYDTDGRRAAVVVTSGSVADSIAVLDAVRGRLWVTFWIALIAAGGLGYGFAEFIGRRVRQMSQAAVAIADGDFDQRVPTSLVPDEVHELAQSYNRMAVTLGDLFTALREQEQEIAAVVEWLGEGVVAFDSEGAVGVINPEAISLLELDGGPEEIVGRHVAGLTDDATTLRIVEAGLDGLDISDTATLGERTVLLHSTPIAPGEDTTEGAVLLLSDITEQKRLEEAQRQFVANASHEMRTPIAAVKGLLELLTDGAKEDPSVRDDFLRTMSLEVDRLGRLVADLLTLAQLEAGSLTLDREPVVVCDLMGDITTVMRPLADQAGVTLAVDAPTDPIKADADRDRITQVLVGFVDNALKHSEEGSTVTLRARPHEDTVTLEVHNEGPGIDPDVVPRLFDRFFRADESRASSQGTGLGLSIAKEIIEAHGSTAEVESGPEQGVSFHFDLPRET